MDRRTTGPASAAWYGVSFARLPLHSRRRPAKDIPAWYAATGARAEARATLEQTAELRRVLEELGE